MTAPAIKVEGISYSYGSLEAVKNVSFEVMPGEILGFLGPNGAGKSTAIEVLTGQLTPKSGRAEILGMESAAWGSPAARRIACIPSPRVCVSA